MLSGFDQPSVIRAAIERGAAGFLDKGADVTVIIAAIRTVAAGGTVFRAAHLRAHVAAPRRPSDREVQVIELVNAGATNAEVGARARPVREDRREPSATAVRSIRAPVADRAGGPGARRGLGRRPERRDEPGHRATRVAAVGGVVLIGARPRRRAYPGQPAAGVGVTPETLLPLLIAVALLCVVGLEPATARRAFAWFAMVLALTILTVDLSPACASAVAGARRRRAAALWSIVAGIGRDLDRGIGRARTRRTGGDALAPGSDRSGIVAISIDGPARRLDRRHAGRHWDPRSGRWAW